MTDTNKENVKPRDDKVIPVSEMDFLEEDDPIRGQSYACVSFLSPEDILEKKEVFFFDKFTKYFSTEVRGLFENLMLKYPDDKDTLKSIADKYRYLFTDGHMQDEYRYFCNEKSEELNAEFSEKVDFVTSVRGFKLRGCYDTLRAAQVRSEVLKRKDNKHNIYICTVGCWCPWSPSVDDIDDVQYGEDSLNTLMQKYKDNQAHKDMVFEDRKKDMLEDQRKSNKAIEENNKVVDKLAQDKSLKSAIDDLNDTDNVVIPVEGSNLTETVIKSRVVTDDCPVMGTSGLTDDKTVNENVDKRQAEETNDKLTDVDPWMVRKLEKEKLNSEGVLPPVSQSNRMAEVSAEEYQ
jgi:hypothetical protein